MRKSKKALALILALAMSVTCFGCGSDSKTTDSDKTKTSEATVTSEDPTANISTDASDKFYVYSWNTELQDRLEYFKKAYPEYAKRIEYVNIGDSSIYQEKIDALLSSPDAKDYPDLMATEADYIMKYTSSDYTLPVTDLGITEDDTANMYDYTKQVATSSVDNTLKGLSWQACPGALMYRRDLAKKYLGTDDPEKVQEYFKDWDTFLDTARKIDKDSNGKTKILSGNDDVSRVYTSNKTSAWVDKDQNFVIDQQILDYMDMYKTLEQENLTNKTSQWTEQWNANVASDNTFAYFGCTWFLHWTLKANCGGDKVGKGTYGKWAMCQGPSTYYWGGTWLCATQNCSDKGLAGLIMKTLCCDTDTMYKIAEETLDYVNNKASVQKLIDDKKGSYDFLGGQDFLAVFEPLAEKVDVSWMCAYDQKINTELDTQLKAYATGKKDKDTAIADLKKAVLNDYPTLNVQ